MMKNNSIIIKSLVSLLLIMAVWGLNLSAMTNIQLKFRNNNTFKIAQFTDLHWDNTASGCAQTTKTILDVLSVEKPDLVVITGDVVTGGDALKGWMAVTKIFIDAKIPYAITLGNHDAEPDITRDQIFDLLETLPYFIGSKGPELPGCGNYSLPIQSSVSNSTAAVLYCMDSNDYPSDKKVSKYDWIRFDQIGWFRSESDQYTLLNNGFPLPSLMFFHIPLPEFQNIAEDKNTVGIKKEGISSASINSGLFASMVEKKDIMGLFVGHDHDNDYIGMDHEIALAFGQVTGSDVPYGELEKGARIIELQENKFSFNTWIRTAKGVQFFYNYPSGILTDNSNVEYLPATLLSGLLQQGVNYSYFEGKFTSTDELSKVQSKTTGKLRNISIESASVRDSFAFEFNAWLRVPVKAIYRFYTYSDDGSKLFIDGKVVVDNDGSHSAERANGQVALDEGYHQFKLRYFEDYMGNELEVGISSINIRECKIPDSFLYIK